LLNGKTQGINGSVPNGPSSEALFDGNVSNASITWDTNFVFNEMVLGGAAAYTGQQTIYSAVTVELDGSNADNLPSLAMPVTSSKLNLWFADGNSVFQIDNTATITNMDLESTDAVGQFVIHGGTTTIAASPGGYSDLIGVYPFTGRG
jgi:hypothetical protein